MGCPMIHLVLKGFGVLTLLALVGLASLFNTHARSEYREGWCDGFYEYEVELLSRGMPISTRTTQTLNGFQVRLDDGRVMQCGENEQ
jgi:hypothetical protein